MPVHKSTKKSKPGGKRKPATKPRKSGTKKKKPMKGYGY